MKIENGKFQASRSSGYPNCCAFLVIFQKHAVWSTIHLKVFPLPLNAPNCTQEKNRSILDHQKLQAFESSEYSNYCAPLLCIKSFKFSNDTKLQFQTMSTCLGGSLKSFKLPRVASTQIIVFLLQIFKDIKSQFQTMFTCLSNSFQKLEASGSG
jgi:hypothetical protein